MNALSNASVVSWGAIRSTWYMAGAVSGWRSGRFALHSVPGAPRTPFQAHHALLDEVIGVYFKVGREPFAGLDVASLRAELEMLAENPLEHGDPDAPRKVRIVPQSFAGIKGEWLSFSSQFRLNHGVAGAERWGMDPANGVAHAAIMRHDDHQDRPWLVMVHGAEMGRRRLDARIFRAQRLFDELGVNIAMPVLPAHGVRAPLTGPVRGNFPNDDVVGNIHGMMQGVWDVRRLMAWIRTESQMPLGLYGFSLGGNIVSQISRLDEDVDAIVAACPAVDLMGLMADQLLPSDRYRYRHLVAAAREAGNVISPLASKPLVPPERLALIGAAHDRLTDPIDQVAKLWRHWGKPDFEVMQRSHVSYMFGPAATDIVISALRKRNLAKV